MKDSKTVRKTVITVVEEMLGIEVCAQSTLAELGIDSLDVIEMTHKLEGKLDIDIDIEVEQFDLRTATLGEFIELIEAHVSLHNISTPAPAAPRTASV